jgi:hypothetical protein
MSQSSAVERSRAQPSAIKRGPRRLAAKGRLHHRAELRGMVRRCEEKGRH